MTKRLIAVLLVASVFAACDLDRNGDEVLPPDGGAPDGPASWADATTSSGGSSSGASDATPDAPGDAVIALVDGCTATGTEVCTDGIDNDCNGLVDCADPTCASTGYRCVSNPAADPGWTFATFEASGQPACPTGTTAHLVDVNPTNLSAAASCACNCTPSAPPSCEQGAITSSYGTTTCDTPFTGQTPAGGTCHAERAMLWPYLQVSTTASGGSCAGNVTATVPPTGATKGEWCDGESAFGAGCAPGNVCALAPSGFAACVHQGGAAGCPPGYAASNAVGQIQDTRGCGTCGCSGTPTATCAGQWLFFTGTDCSGAAALTVIADGTCHATGYDGTQVYQVNEYSASPSNLVCGPPTTPPSPNGSAALGQQDTICCE